MPSSERVLYVDDDALCRRSFAREMRQSGFIVDVAETAEEALALAQRYPYAVLAADWRMPGLDGVRLVELVRQGEDDPVCLLITGADDEAIGEINASRIGIDCVIRKPWDAEALAVRIRDALDGYTKRQKSVRERRLERKTDVVLVVEDDEDVAQQLCALLASGRSSGYSVLTVDSMSQALEYLEEGPAHAVLLSLDLGDCPGVEAIRKVLGCQPATPVLAISGALNDSLSLAAVQCGAQDFLLRRELEANLLARSLQHAVERKRSEEKLAHIAHHDQLTGLANRSLLGERLEQAIARAQRKQAKVAVFFLDLDRFKMVNDTLGHDAGDQLLIQVAQRLRGSVRGTDTVARLGGDEFAVVLEDLDRSEEATLLAGRVLNSFATPFRLDGGEVITTTSVGIAMHPHNGSAVDQLLKCADSAMYRAKQTGRDNYQFFSEELHAQAVAQIELEGALSTSVENQDFLVHFQPQIDAQTHRVVGAEALVRWRRSKDQLVPPSEFIPALEDTGLIIPVGEFVLRRACAQLKAWNTSSDFHLRMAVNISARQFEDVNFVPMVKRALSDHKLEGGDLELEITETVLMRDTGRTRQAFEQLRAMGVRIAIDDFGTGYSSLAYLKTFPIDALKIDRSFLDDVSASSSGATLASAVIALGQSLNLAVVAEGVETVDQLSFLKKHRCDLLQGHLVGMPGDAADTTRWLIEAAGRGGAWCPPLNRQLAAPPAAAAASPKRAEVG